MRWRVQVFRGIGEENRCVFGARLKFDAYSKIEQWAVMTTSHLALIGPKAEKPRYR
jgi:hypothetical protein